MLECVRSLWWIVEATRRGDSGVVDTEWAESGTLGDWVCRMRRREVLESVECVRWIVQGLEYDEAWTVDIERAEWVIGFADLGISYLGLPFAIRLSLISYQVILFLIFFFRLKKKKKKKGLAGH